MNFEITMRLLFGERAYGIAGTQGSPKSRTKWLQRATKKLLGEVNALDTTDRHKQALMGEIEVISSLLKPTDTPSWSLVYHLFRLVSRLLGFDFVRGAKCHTVTYWQTPAQNLNTVVFSGGDIMQDYYDQRNAIAVRRKIVHQLRQEGLSTYTIALALNVTEYQVKKLHGEDPSKYQFEKAP